MKFISRIGALCAMAACLARVGACPALSTANAEKKSGHSSHCFPALDFRMPHAAPQSVDNWWCDQKNEYAFMGFSYEVTACQSREEMKSDFQDIRSRFRGRYVRLYGFCDRQGFYNDVVEAAWSAGVGVHALIWFGFDGGDEWRRRRDALFHVLHSNPKAKFVTRVVQFGSEPLFDEAIDPYELAAEVKKAKKNLAPLHIPVTVSDLAFSYQRGYNNGAKEVLEAINVVDAHMLPFFSAEASTAKKAWPLVKNDLEWFVKHSSGKKIYLSENGWPSVTSPGVQPNSRNAVANVRNEHDYYALLDEHCPDLKAVRGGGVGWFAHTENVLLKAVDYGAEVDSVPVLEPSDID
ncbi:hypothetical protein AX17_005516 [Amanita inopinata Kibby_2008]|nr:hypothetical protein AX17_005516 [Amanita inopinata Kibby_2008]